MAQTQSYQTPNTFGQQQQQNLNKQFEQQSASDRQAMQQAGSPAAAANRMPEQNRHLDSAWSREASSHELELRRQQQLRQQQQMQTGATSPGRSAADMQARYQGHADRQRQMLAQDFAGNMAQYQGFADRERQIMATPLMFDQGAPGQMSTNMPPQQQGWGQQQAQWRPPVQWQQQAAFNSPANYGYGGMPYGMQGGYGGGYPMPQQSGYGMPMRSSYPMQQGGWSGYGGGYGGYPSMPPQGGYGMQGGYSPYQSAGFNPYAQQPAVWR